MPPGERTQPYHGAGGVVRGEYQCGQTVCGRQAAQPRLGDRTQSPVGSPVTVVPGRLLGEDGGIEQLRGGSSVSCLFCGMRQTAQPVGVLQLVPGCVGSGQAHAAEQSGREMRLSGCVAAQCALQGQESTLGTHIRGERGREIAEDVADTNRRSGSIGQPDTLCLSGTGVGIESH